MNDASPEVIQSIWIGRVLPNPLNPRGTISDDSCLELAASIRAAGGILEPLIVVPYRDGYYAVAGHRRRIAARLAGLTQLPCIVREMTDGQQLDIMMIENLQREDFTPYQEAQGFQSIMTTDSVGVTELVRRIGVSANYINQRLNILKLEAGTQEVFQVHHETIPIGAAALLRRVKDPKDQRRYALDVSKGALTLSSLEKIIIQREQETAAPADGEQPTRQRAPSRPYSSARVLGEDELFTRSQVIEAAEPHTDRVVKMTDVLATFNDICEGVCDSAIMCQACPAPRIIASIMRRSNLPITGSDDN